MSGASELQKSKWICTQQASVIFLAVVLLAVLGLSLTPHPESVLGRLSVYDKAEHFIAYIVLGFFAVRSIGRRGVLPLVLAIASCAAMGGLIEIIQPLVGRNKELADFLVDLGGAAIGAVVGAVVAFPIMRKDPAGRKGRKG